MQTWKFFFFQSEQSSVTFNLISETQRRLVHHGVHTHHALTFSVKGSAVLHQPTCTCYSKMSQCNTESFDTCNITSTDTTHVANWMLPDHMCLMLKHPDQTICVCTVLTPPPPTPRHFARASGKSGTLAGSLWRRVCYTSSFHSANYLPGDPSGINSYDQCFLFYSTV